MGLPSVEELRERLSLTDLQASQIAAIYDRYRDRAKVLEREGDANQKARLRRDLLVLIKEVCTPDQRQRLDDFLEESVESTFPGLGAARRL